jgi:hypothetical protein
MTSECPELRKLAKITINAMVLSGNQNAQNAQVM